ncbi:hypothetical protein FNL56_07760 [Tardiphaga sp. vice304]|nr:hypothetical protein FNL56_07760 [Tardiphaga sp. vice304]
MRAMPAAAATACLSCSKGCSPWSATVVASTSWKRKFGIYFPANGACSNCNLPDLTAKCVARTMFSRSRHAWNQGSVVAAVTASVYDGGLAAAQPQQGKELTTQSRLVLDMVRNQARTAATAAWVSNEGAKAAVSAAESEVRAAGVALAGVQREGGGGQRTTVDVLNAQQDLVSAKARR